MLELVFTSRGWEDYLYWQKHDRRKLQKLNELLRDILRGDPASGIGKPEPLKHELAGAWSRRIDFQHRLVYLVRNDQVIVLQARMHY